MDCAVIFLCFFGLFKLKFKLKKPPLFLTSAILFIAIAILSLVFTPLHLDLQEILISFMYTVRFSVYTLLGWLIFSGAFPSIKNNIFKILVFSGLCVAVLGLAQFIFLPDLRFLATDGWDPHFLRTVSTFLDPNFAGAFFVLTLLLVVSRSYLGGRSMMTPGVFIMLSIIYLALLTTFSRSGYLMFLVSFLTFSFLKKSIKIAVLTIILFAFLLLSFQIYIKAVNRVTPLDRTQTASFRLSTWQQGFEIFMKNPILGIGFNAYNFALKQYKLGDKQFLEGRGATTNDSSLLYILATTGILGFLAYFLFILGIIKISKPILTAAILGLLAHSVFVNSLFYPFILVWLMLMASYFYDRTNIK